LQIVCVKNVDMYIINKWTKYGESELNARSNAETELITKT